MTESPTRTPPDGTGDFVKQPVSITFGELPDDFANPLNSTRSRLKQPVSTIFGEGNTIGSPENRSTDVILDADGKPKGLALNHQRYGYTESKDLTVIRQPITTRFGDPMSRPTIPELPGTQRKYVGLPARPLLPKKTLKREDKDFLDI